MQYLLNEALNHILKNEVSVKNDFFVYLFKFWENVFFHCFIFPKTLTKEAKNCIGQIIRSDQISCSVVSDSLRPHESQHARPPCISPIPGVHTNSRPWSQWCHPTISSSVVPFSSHLQSFPASRSFQMSQFCTSGGQRIRVSAYQSFQRNPRADLP